MEGCNEYYVPEGTTEICEGAFYNANLDRIYLPETVTAIRNGAFFANAKRPLFVKLPDSLKNLPAKAFLGPCGWDDYKCYYVSTASPDFAEKICKSTGDNERIPIYTGGPLTDLSSKCKSFAVAGFLHAEEHGLADMSAWRDSYYEHIKKNEKTYISHALLSDFLFYLMIDNNLLSLKGAEQLLDVLTDRQDVSMLAALINYKATLPQEEFDFSKGERSVKLKIAQDERREQIKNQKGIKGLVFVASGELNNFGYFNEYTGAHDLSDLKEFIEARGGFLRSAVSRKTDYLICNYPNSGNQKAEKAKELGVEIISELDFMQKADN